jgi:uncharacterized protein YbjT (DUF2867 family)
MEKAMSSVERVFMLLPVEKDMLQWAKNIIDAAKKAQVKFILRSSIIDADPVSDYQLFKVHGQIDQLLMNSGISFCIIHPNSFMQNFIVYYGDGIVNNDTISFAEGNGRISFTDVRDIAAVAAEILLNPKAHEGREYEVTGPEALTNYDVAEILSNTLNREIRYAPQTEAEYVQGLKDMQYSDWDIAVMLSLERHIRDGRSAEISEYVTMITGREPVNFSRFAHEHADAWSREAVHA